jgi:hypothetical protein
MMDDLEKAKNLKLLLCAFEQFSGLKINFHKSDVLFFGDAKISENVLLSVVWVSNRDISIQVFRNSNALQKYTAIVSRKK